jgi:phosphatidate cytidylyltransferase
MRKRIVMGTLMAVLAAGMLGLDAFLAPLYPFLFIAVFLLALTTCLEMNRLLAATPNRPPFWLFTAGVIAVLLANWPAHLLHTAWSWIDSWPISWFQATGAEHLSPWGDEPKEAWFVVLCTFAALVILTFGLEIGRYRVGGGAVQRIALTLLVVVYLGLLPSFLVQLRWQKPLDDAAIQRLDLRAVTALALVIFVPKCGDIAAFFTGKLLGRRRMAPVLSPKKTWEGFAGGLVGSVLTAVAINHIGEFPALGTKGLEGVSVLTAIGFGLTVGLAGVLGDLAESLIKRDCLQKDASQAVPGFGGVLDVIDSILFAAPVAYLWLRW